jgi:hypothetical protein
MENKRTSKKIQGDSKNNLSCIRKIIKHQEKLYNVRLRNGRWVRRYNVKGTKS